MLGLRRHEPVPGPVVDGLRRGAAIQDGRIDLASSPFRPARTLTIISAGDTLVRSVYDIDTADDRLAHLCLSWANGNHSGPFPRTPSRHQRPRLRASCRP